MENRGRGRGQGAPRKLHSKNRQWVSGQENGHGSDAERWERGGGYRRGRGRGRGNHTHSSHLSVSQSHEDGFSGTEDEDQEGMDEGVDVTVDDGQIESQEDPEKFYKELVRAREVEKQKAIAEGKMSDPSKPVALDEAITLVGTCQDMCPMFERYRREREHNLSPWEMIPGTKRVDHQRAVKMYERGAGDKTLPSDLRPPLVLKRTLDYLFHDLIPRGGFSETWSFVRDRSRQVRNDFTIQHESGPIAVECHDRCARFHILALHFERKNPGFSIAMEEQQLMHVLLSLIQFYTDHRKGYTSPTELEMRVYHRLIHIRDQIQRNEDVPDEVQSHPVFQLINQFRLHVQEKSVPITKTSKLIVDSEALQIFGRLAAVLREQNNIIMIYLVACIMERLFGDDTIEDIELIRGDLSIPQIIDGIAMPITAPIVPLHGVPSNDMKHQQEKVSVPVPPSVPEHLPQNFGSQPLSSVFGAPSNAPQARIDPFPPTSQPKSAFSTLTTTPNAFGSTGIFGGSNVFNSGFGSKVQSAFGPSKAVTPQILTSNLTPLPAVHPSEPPALTQSPSTLPNGSVFSSSPVPVTSSVFPSQPSFSKPRPKLQTPLLASPPGPSSSHLNPQASEFIPPSTSSIFQSPSPAQPSKISHPTTSPSNAQQRPTIEIPKASFVDLPATSNSFPPEVDPPAHHTSTPPTIPPVPEEKHTPRIVERRQTLWELPGTAPQTPPSQSAYNEPISPREPPPLARPQPLSLPPTPTARWFDPSSQIPKPSEGSLSLRKQSLKSFPPTLQFAPPTAAEILSPLQLPSPGMFRGPVYDPGSPSPSSRPSASGLTAPSSPEKEATVDTKEPSPAAMVSETSEITDLPKIASTFRRSRLEKIYFAHWLQRATDSVAWKDACARSETYKEQIQLQQLSKGAEGPTLHKKRKISTSSPISTTHWKRTRKRISSEYRPPLSDESLAQRLKENQVEHQKRWAQGSFLRTIQTQIRDLSPDGNYPPHWRIWLSTNDENDNTAIWLNHKLNVPGDGHWVSKVIFSIPLEPISDDSKTSQSPGLILFERTPLGDIDDPIERKYRVLDDCSRLRDIVDFLRSDTEKRRYLPVLLVVSWTDPKLDDEFLDFTDMAEFLTEEALVKSVSRFHVSSNSTDVDKEFKTHIAALDLEVEDRVSQILTWENLTELFTTPLAEVAGLWLQDCWVHGAFDWTRYGRVLRAIKKLQSTVTDELLTLIGSPPVTELLMPVDLEAPAHLGQEYALGPFLEAQIKLPIAAVEQSLGDLTKEVYTFDKDDIQASVHRFEASLVTAGADMKEFDAMTALTPSPSKRRAAEDEDSRLTSPSSAPKRFRGSVSVTTDEDDIMATDGALTNGDPTSPVPSTVESTIETSKPVVTVAMLRALTRSVLNAR